MQYLSFVTVLSSHFHFLRKGLFVYLERQLLTEKETGTQIELFHLLVHFPEGHGSQHWANPEQRLQIWVFHKVLLFSGT